MKSELGEGGHVKTAKLVLMTAEAGLLVQENQRRKRNEYKKKVEYDPAIPPLGIYLEKTILQKDTCTPVYPAALFPIVKTWKQPKCPSTDEWVKKMWYIYTMEYYSAIKREQNNAICSNMDGPRDCHTE